MVWMGHCEVVVGREPSTCACIHGAAKGVMKPMSKPSMAGKLHPIGSLTAAGHPKQTRENERGSGIRGGIHGDSAEASADARSSGRAAVEVAHIREPAAGAEVQRR